MASSSFDLFQIQEKPSVTLCNPDLVQIYSLDACYATSIKLKWNAQSEISFSYPKFIGDIALDAFDYIEGKRIILVENIGYFIISDVQDDFDGSVPIKTVTALSIDSELVFKKLNLFSGTFKFYDTIITTGSPNLLGTIISLIPNWTIGNIDSSLINMYRTFNVSDTNIYQFLTTDVSVAYNCVFVFDYTNKIISVIPSSQAITPTIIFLSFENLLKNTQYKEITNEISTAFYCYGGNNLTIRDVNPLGTNVIYNFTYYKTTDWMSQSLINAINAWETKVNSYISIYDDYLFYLAAYNSQLLDQQSSLVQWQTNLSADQQVRAVRIAGGLDTTEIDAQIVADEQQISYYNLQIGITNAAITNLINVVTFVNNDLAFTNTNNFTNAQVLELNNFIFENVYKNDNIITTDTMTYAEIQAQSQQLYNSAIEVLGRAAIPRYQIIIDSVNFLALKEYQPFIDQLELGSQVTIDSGRGYFIDAVLLEYDYSFDDPEQFAIVLSNRKRLDDSSFIFTDLFGQNFSGNSNSSFNSSTWNDWLNTKPTIVGNVIAPDGATTYGVIAENVVGEINANNTLSITNTNVSTGVTNFQLDQHGATLRDATYISGSNIGVDGDLSMAGGGAIFFRKGIYIGGAGLAPGSNVITYEDLTSQVITAGSYFYVSGSFLVNSLRVYLNGLMQRQSINFSENPDVRSFSFYESVVAGDSMSVEYVGLT
jgi:hypothetical protein